MTIRAGANAIHTDADLQKQPIMLPRTMPREKPMASAPTIICHGITLSPLLRALIRSHVDALGRYGVWPSRFTVVVEMSGPELSAGYGVRTHVIIGGPGLQLSVLRTSGEGPRLHDVRIAIKCCFVAVEAELIRRTGLQPS